MELEFFDDQTLNKVYNALARAGVTGQQAIDAVNQMQNEGVLFRERRLTDIPGQGLFTFT